MGGKKKGDKKKKKEASEPVGATIDDFRSNYIKACKALGISADSSVVSLLTPEEEGALTQLCTDADLGPAGIRALCAALMGKGAGMRGGPYGALKSLRFWRNNGRDAGAAAVADVLIHGGEAVQLTHLQLMDNKIAGPGCLALGEALMLGANTSLMTLRLDHNVTIGTEGLAQLVKGLRTNHKLSSLYLEYCGIGPDAGKPLSQLLAFPASALTIFDLEGNSVGSESVMAMADALKTNTALKDLRLCNNAVGASKDEEVNQQAMANLAEALLSPTGGLAKLDLEMNSLSIAAAEKLLPAMVPENTRVKILRVDDTLPKELFEKLQRADKGGGKKKGKKGKKKGKKKK